MLYEVKDGKILTQALEYSVAYHCNLKCSGCSHMSPFIDEKLPPLESFRRDVEALSGVLHAKDIRLLGGEPLLNPQINDYLKIARSSGVADQIMVTTNGLLLHKADDEFWENVDYMWMSIYPGAAPPEKMIEKYAKKAEEFGVRLDLDRTTHFRTTVTTEAHADDWVTDMIFKTCRSAHLFHCHMIYEGTLFKCACPPFMPEYLGRFGIEFSPQNDGFDIHGASNLFEELRDFLFTRKTLDACRYCLGYVGSWQDHRQLSKQEIGEAEVRVTRADNMSRRKLAQETIKYFGRRVGEALGGRGRW
jgi:hypothetical protein